MNINTNTYQLFITISFLKCNDDAEPYNSKGVMENGNNYVPCCDLFLQDSKYIEVIESYFIIGT